MVLIEFIVDEEELELCLRSRPERESSAVLLETYFNMPMRFWVGTTDILNPDEDSVSRVGLRRVPLLGFAGLAVPDVERVQYQQEVVVLVPGGFDLVFRRDGANVRISPRLHDIEVVAPIEDVVEALVSFRESEVVLPDSGAEAPVPSLLRELA